MAMYFLLHHWNTEFCLQSVQTRHNKMLLYPYTALKEEYSALSEGQQRLFKPSVYEL
jgi:hypothetical protein